MCKTINYGAIGIQDVIVKNSPPSCEKQFYLVAYVNLAPRNYCIAFFFGSDGSKLINGQIDTVI